MTLWHGSTAELVTAFVAAVAIPFYLGLIHFAVGQLVLYSGVAGAAMAVGDYAQNPGLRRGGVPLFLVDVAAWSLVISLLGGLIYLAALIF